MFGLFKEKISKRNYGAVLAENAMQYISEASKGVDAIFKNNEDGTGSILNIEDNFSEIFSIQLISCIAVGELSVYSMEQAGISVYEVRTGFLDHVKVVQTGLSESHGWPIEVNCLETSQDIESLISTNSYLKKTGKFYSGQSLNEDDIYGQIAIYIFNYVTRDHPEFQKLIFKPESLNGALQLEMAIDSGLRAVHEMYKSYKLV